MSIVKAINELSGKEAVTIEDAIRNVELGGGGATFMIINAETTNEQALDSIDKTFDEIADFIISGGFPIFRLVINDPNAPYAATRFYTVNYSQLDFSPSVGGGTIEFECAAVDIQLNNVYLVFDTITMIYTGEVTLKHSRKTLT